MAGIGPHALTKVLEEKDVNGLRMVMCRACNAYAHALTVEEAKADLAKTPCSADCENCKALGHSHAQKPAMPLNGSCNNILHTCPNDNTRWWQFNTHFHLWKRVTSDGEWEGLRRDMRNLSDSEYLDGLI